MELVWDRKYDKSGTKTAPVSVALPFQTIETLNESTQQRQKSIESFLTGRGETEWRNRLIWGDKKYVLPSLLPEFANSVDLIYIDPPFGTGADFSFIATVPDDPDATEGDSLVFTKEPSIIEQKAYRDTWGHGLDTYLHWFYETAALLHELLNDRGSIYVHLDSGVSHYAKLILDEVFGAEQFVNEIVWRRAFAHNDPARCGMIHDVLLFYSKTESRTWNDVLQKPSREYVEQFFDQYDETRKERYERLPLDAPRHGAGGNLLYEWKGVWPAKNRTWAVQREKMEEYDRAGRIHYPKKGIPRLKRYESEYEGTVLQDIWTDINKIHNQSPELLHYPTQKPEALLERILKTSSNEGDLVLDCFVGSGTTAAVAEKLGRRWIVCDLSRFAIHTTRKRLLSVENLKPFVIQNLGKYERQAWQTAEFGDEAGTKVRSYTSFILKLYNAQPLNGYIWLHGKKGARLVHVGSVDSPISPLDVGQIVAEFKRSIGTGKEAPRTNGVDVLGWDFAFELNELAKQQVAQANVDLRFLRIPREVLDKKAVEQGDVRFFELASLDVGVKTSGKKATVTIKDFVIPADDVPSDIQKEINHWSQWIDYWAVDWNNKNDTFHNEWQEYRTREKPKLVTETSKTYDEHGEYRVVVKVIDILGNDTTKLLRVKV
ncbi:MAG: site-specific DNA-methyltransferase [Candidatus Bathyarchaeia archaeon]